jgi:hypothetical protein
MSPELPAPGVPPLGLCACVMHRDALPDLTHKRCFGEIEPVKAPG